MIIHQSIVTILDYFLPKISLRIVEQTKIFELKDFFKMVSPRETNRSLIRVGPNGDGGYLIPDDLVNISSCFSPGVDLESGFELDLANKGLKIFLADYSVKMPVINHRNFFFMKKYIGSYGNDLYMTLDTWVDTVLPSDKNSDLILQMDIEGFEYESIFSISDKLLKRFRIIVVEFHYMERLFERNWYKKYSRIFKKLTEHHTVVHIHPNNQSKVFKYKNFEIPGLLEFTFYRNDRISNEEFTLSFPHELDRKNVERKNDIFLPKCWYEHGCL